MKHIIEFLKPFFKCDPKATAHYFASQELDMLNREIKEREIRREKLEKIYLNTMQDNTCHI